MTEKSILDSWNENASQWQAVIEAEQIESRKVATNKAILDSVIHKDWTKVLDVGCGEGWLVNALRQRDTEAYGVDGSHKLIELARKKDKDIFQCLSYEEIISGEDILYGPFDGIVINFALFDKDRPRFLLKKLRTYLRALDSGILIQTLPPRNSPKDQAWKFNAWDGLPGNFSSPYTWYHQSKEEWQTLFRDAHLRLDRQIEVLHPSSQQHLSTIFELENN